MAEVAKDRIRGQEERAFDAWADIKKTHPGNKTLHASEPRQERRYARGGMVKGSKVTKSGKQHVDWGSC